MPKHITEWNIYDIMTRYPNTREVFVHNGFAPFADDAVLRQWGAMLKLRTALQAKHIQERWFLPLLEQKIEEAENAGLAVGAGPGSHVGRLNLLALLPCPLKVPIETELSDVLQRLQEKKGLKLNVCIESNADHPVKFLDYVKYFTEPDELPDIILLTGFHFMLREFVERFVETGIFTAVPNQDVNRRLTGTELVDADGHFSVIAANALVMVADIRRLGEVPAPQSWGNILQPAYEGKVVIRGHKGSFCDIVQLNYYKDYGAEGLAKLAKAVKYGLHPAEMVRELSSSRPQIPPIHIMPYFFARTLANHSHLEIIWPEEGALAYPILVLVKKDQLETVRELAECLTGPRIARICAGASFPAIHPEASWAIPSEARLKWIGWNFVKQQNIEQLIEQLNADFLAVQQAERADKKVAE
ncbi:hypothetical protein P22_0937 [Propionispora sp. 2/2-37]|uniref:ABC transporter substrate-binding protein n=1 Tax=Propionispora sp. 2/2-37 TaxID=1677858 RepID=UPI0006C0F51B|nr:ABC transporter substrate-binding protein [Propionispora sp. 2/2-37]CUH94871.1 hypothetical protein P22_0937 [Propionispora sp. 2/2-37]